MITTLLVMALGGWNEVKANGFVFEMPEKAVLESGPVTWPTTGQMVQTQWTSKVETGDKQYDVVRCFESTVPSPKMVGVLHEKFCKDAPGQQKLDRVDPKTQARECMQVTDAPDGKRKVLVRILEVGANVCMLSSSAKIEKGSEEPTPQMRRFVDSLKATGKQTVLAATTPWETMKGDGFTFQAPQKMESATADETDPKLGTYKGTRWKLSLGEENLSVLCMSGPKVSAAQATQVLINGISQMPGTKVVQTRLPNGATECAVSGSHTGLMRIFPMAKQTCLIGATRQTGETTQDARRFVESFAKAK